MRRRRPDGDLDDIRARVVPEDVQHTAGDDGAVSVARRHVDDHRRARQLTRDGVEERGPVVGSEDATDAERRQRAGEDLASGPDIRDDPRSLSADMRRTTESGGGCGPMTFVVPGSSVSRSAPGPSEEAMAPLYLAGYDGSRASRAAVSFATRLAEATGAEVLVVDVYETAAHSGVRGVALPGADLVEADIRRAVERRLEELTEPAIQRIAHPAASAAEGLHRLAEDRNAALVVVGRTHRGHIGRHTRGSVAGRLLHGLHCPLAVVPDGVMPTPRTIAVGYDDSPEAQAALAFATDLAERLGARLVLAGVAEPGVYAHPEISPDAWGRLGSGDRVRSRTPPRDSGAPERTSPAT